MSETPSTVASPPPPRVRPRHHRPRITTFVIALIVCSSCSGDATDVLDDTMGREEFIQAYVELRVEALSLGTTQIGDVRDSLLAVYGVTGEDLLAFVDTHGEEVEFMRDLWAEIEELMTERLEQNAEEEENEELEQD